MANPRTEDGLPWVPLAAGAALVLAVGVAGLVFLGGPSDAPEDPEDVAEALDDLKRELGRTAPEPVGPRPGALTGIHRPRPRGPAPLPKFLRDPEPRAGGIDAAAPAPTAAPAPVSAADKSKLKATRIVEAQMQKAEQAALDRVGVAVDTLIDDGTLPSGAGEKVRAVLQAEVSMIGDLRDAVASGKRTREQALDDFQALREDNDVLLGELLTDTQMEDLRWAMHGE